VDGGQLSPRARLAIAVAAALVVLGVGGAVLAGGESERTSGAAVALSSAQDAVAAQQRASALSAYAVQAQATETVEDLRAHGVVLRRFEGALGEPLRSRAVAVREAAQSDAGVAALRAFGREVQKTSARLQSLLAALGGARSPAQFDRLLARIAAETGRGQPGEGGGGAVGADDPVPPG
jgi:hypothetical protein